MFVLYSIPSFYFVVYESCAPFLYIVFLQYFYFSISLFPECVLFCVIIYCPEFEFIVDRERTRAEITTMIASDQPTSYTHTL